MDDYFEELVIDVRATTDGFTSDLEQVQLCAQYPTTFATNLFDWKMF